MVYTLWLSSVLTGIGGFIMVGIAHNVLGEISGSVYLLISTVFYVGAAVARAVESQKTRP